MERTGGSRKAVPGLIFAASFASLAYELALMRIFSISLWYHFAFMVISIAMLGIGASGTVLSIFPRLKDLQSIPRYALVLAVTIPASYLLANIVPFDPIRLSWDRLQVLTLSLFYLILAVPFFFFGLIVSTAYATMSREAHAVYAADLTGAGASAAAMAWLLSFGGPETTVFLVSILLASRLLYQTGWKVRTAAVFVIAVYLSILYLRPSVVEPRISPYKPFAVAMQHPGAQLLGTAYSPYSRVDLFKGPAVRFAPGLSFTYLESLPEQTGIAVDAGDIHAITDETDSAKLAFVRSLASSLAYRLSANQDVLIIEPRAGVSLLTARLFNAQNISAIDSNPLVLRVMREYGQTHGSVMPEDVRPGLARTWLATTGRTFDIIDLSAMGSFPSAAFGFSEDYRFTKEAFSQYLSHLKPEGFLSLSLYIIPPPRTELRLIASLAAAAETQGIEDISRHTAAMRSWDTLTLIIKKSPLTSADIRTIRTFSRDMRFDTVYCPGMRPDESNVYIKQPGNEYAEAFRRLINREARARFMEEYLFDIRPVSDDRPFFHYFLKIRNLRTTYHVMGKKWQYFMEEGYLLPVLFLQVVIVSVMLILLPLARLKVDRAATNGRSPLPALSYFALLGIAYLFVETAFIQKMILNLENASYAASAVIASVLIGSGIGSALASRIRMINNTRILIVLAGLVFLYSFLLPGMIGVMAGLELTMKIILSFLLILPAGILMGAPFPLGISVLGESFPRLIPWAWSVNGCFSVLAPILAVMLALSTGYQIVLFSGAAAYLAAFAVIRKVQDVV
jgi:MFS family permease